MLFLTWCVTSSVILSSVCCQDTQSDSCSSDSECTKWSGVLCNSTTNRCQCRDLNLVLDLNNGCLERRSLKEKCISSAQCVSSYATCDDEYCKCVKGYYLYSNVSTTTCRENSGGSSPKPNPTVGNSQEENMLPVVVVMAIMFIGMCVALQMFSRARFRNQRTVFNSPNPRLLNKDLKKRRHSQSSGTGSRRPSIASGAGISNAGSPQSMVRHLQHNNGSARSTPAHSVTVVQMEPQKTEVNTDAS